MSKKQFLFLSAWPIVLLLGFMALSAHKSEPPSGRSIRNDASNTPTGIVHRLWAIQAKTADRTNAIVSMPEIKPLLSSQAKESFQQATTLYAEKRIEKEEKVSADRVIVHALLIVSPPHRDGFKDNTPTRWRRYVLNRESGQWKIAQIRAECHSCNGKGSDECYICDGSGRSGYPESTCTTCLGKGTIVCSICHGKGWTDLVAESGDVGSY